MTMIYVDNYCARFGRMIMCHMMADTEEELDQMAARIGLRKSWKQPAKGKRPPHYDICLEKKKLAVGLGAKEVSSRELVKLFPLLLRHC